MLILNNLKNHYLCPYCLEKNKQYLGFLCSRYKRRCKTNFRSNFVLKTNLYSFVANRSYLTAEETLFLLIYTRLYEEDDHI